VGLPGSHSGWTCQVSFLCPTQSIPQISKKNDCFISHRWTRRWRRRATAPGTGPPGRSVGGRPPNRKAPLARTCNACRSFGDSITGNCCRVITTFSCKAKGPMSIIGPIVTQEV
jgi:hypothetical protein